MNKNKGKNSKSKSSYQIFRDIFSKSHPEISYDKADSKASVIWQGVKGNPDKINELIIRTKTEVKERDAKHLKAWANFSRPKPSCSKTTDSTSLPRDGDDTNSNVVELTVSDDADALGGAENDQNQRDTPAQDKIKKETDTLKTQIVKLGELRDIGLSTAENKKQLTESKKQLKEKEKKLKYLRNDTVRQRKRRSEKSELLKKLASQNEEASTKLRKFTHNAPGRPALEDTFPNLREAIIQIATAGAGADGRRRNNILQSCQSLDGMKAALKAIGFEFSRQALYYRLVPRRADSEHGKRHVKTVPVKMAKAKTTSRNRHEDSSFSFATKGYLKDIVSHFGQNSVFAVSIDDKAKVPIGITAAKHQAPLVMHMEYEIRLPDHDFVKGTKHKLIPSAYAACKIKSPSPKKDPEITYSGPMYISIRSLKHDSSTAYTHGSDFDTLLSLDALKEDALIDGQLKPIVLAFVDGGPDENPRYPKVQQVAIDHFKKYNLDVYIVMTLASGMSAYNYVERRMAPLSKALAGVLLPHDTFGNHLDSEGKTCDPELEKQNFKRAGESLAEIWSELVLDGHPVIAEFVQDKYCTPDDVDQSWISKHCRFSQYMLQIIKCDDKFCCSEMRTSWKKVFENRFLPAPVPTRVEKTGAVVPERNSTKKGDRFVDNVWHRMAIERLVPTTEFDPMPYDYYCPSIKSMDDKVCKGCKIYFPSKAAVDRHRRGFGCVIKHMLQRNLIPVDRPVLEVETVPDEDIHDADDAIPVISFADILANAPFEEIPMMMHEESDEEVV